MYTTVYQICTSDVGVSGWVVSPTGYLRWANSPIGFPSRAAREPLTGGKGGKNG